jgi:hypothetical protein
VRLTASTRSREDRARRRHDARAGVARALEADRPESLVEGELPEITRAADLFVLNLECCISERGAPVPKVFSFRAPPNLSSRSCTSASTA